MEIYVTHYSYKYGDDLAAYATRELANAARREIAANQWDAEIGGKEPRPADPEELADAYFEIMGERGECFEIHELEVVGS